MTQMNCPTITESRCGIVIEECITSDDAVLAIGSGSAADPVRPSLHFGAIVISPRVAGGCSSPSLPSF
jgi:hypothetical protein